MEKLKLKMIAFPSAGPEIYEEGLNQLKASALDNIIASSKSPPDVLQVITGGSEQMGQEVLQKSTGIAILANEKNNSYAAALEIKAWCNKMQIPSVLFHLNEAQLNEKLLAFAKAKKSLKDLKGQVLGLVGKPSKWLIASNVDATLMNSKFGITLKHIPWENLSSFRENNPDNNFLHTFGETHKDAAKVCTMLRSKIHDYKLNALTVECFPLVNNENVTACLALSLFNDEGIPAGCEGDLSSAIGMMIARELNAKAAWMANITSIDETAESIKLAHCTIATSMVRNFNITTHYETNKGTAIQGDFEADKVTIFRFNNLLNEAFISKGNITARPRSPHACRTQIEVKLPTQKLELLKEKPLGNHHIVVQGDLELELRMLCKLKQINIQ